MIKKITTFIYPYIISLCSIGMLFSVSTLHATSSEVGCPYIYPQDNDDVASTMHNISSEDSYDKDIKKKFSCVLQELENNYDDRNQQPATANHKNKEALEKDLLTTLRQQHFTNVQNRPKEVKNLLDALEYYIDAKKRDDNALEIELLEDEKDEYPLGESIEVPEDENPLKEGIEVRNRRKEFIARLIVGKEFFAEEIGKIQQIKKPQYDHNKVVNSLLQLICLQGGADAELIKSIKRDLKNYDRCIEQFNAIAEKKVLGIVEVLLAQEQTSKDKKASLRKEMADLIALLNKYMPLENALEEAISMLQGALQKRMQGLNKAKDGTITDFKVDKKVNTLLCYLVDTYAKKDTKIKEIKSIQARYKAQFRFKLLETIEKSLENNPKLKNWLEKLNKSEEAIDIDKIITPEIAERVMELDTLIKNSTIGLKQKKKVLTTTLKNLNNIIVAKCSAQFATKSKELFNTISQQLNNSSFDVRKLNEELGRSICFDTIPSFIKNGGKMIKQTTQNNYKSLRQLLDSQKTSGHNLVQSGEWKAWFHKLHHTLQKQKANILPLLGLLLVILLEYYQELQRLQG